MKGKSWLLYPINHKICGKKRVFSSIYIKAISLYYKELCEFSTFQRPYYYFYYLYIYNIIEKDIGVQLWSFAVTEAFCSKKYPLLMR